MPQLDIVTFTGQVFWIFILFFIFYIILSKNVLPLVARILKARHKKLELSRTTVDQFENENKETASNYSTYLVSSLSNLNNETKRKYNNAKDWETSLVNKMQTSIFNEGNSSFYKSTQKAALKARIVEAVTKS